ncbi:MAG: hypothetical protein MN733_30800, partial [Nitrososphaera sp.]|nr:hypothetical protein [Nitrososphaera sp.]
MNERPVWPLAITAIVGIGIGFFLPRSSEPSHSVLVSTNATLVQTRSDANRINTKGSADASKEETSGVDLEAVERFRRKGINISPEELQKTVELSVRNKDNGEYLLRYERPLSKRAHERMMNQMTEELKVKDAAEYDRIFNDFGLDAETSDQLKLHASKITTASLEAEAAIFQVLKARSDYDQRLRSVLSENDYSQYRAEEAERPARRELEKIKEFAHQRGDPLIDEAHQDLIAKPIQTAEAYTDSITHYRPYDGLPDITIGTEPVVMKLSNKMALLSDQVQRLLASADEIGLENRTLLADYFAEEINKRSREIAALGEKLAAATPSQEPLRTQVRSKTLRRDSLMSLSSINLVMERAQQRSLREKELPPFGLRTNWAVAALLVGYSPLAGMRPPRALPQPNWCAT